MTSDFIDDAYAQAIRAGAVGGKLVGAGGGGFLMFYADDKEMLRRKMSELGLEEVRFQFDFEGTKVILS
jgi:D-glycero-alpha-D-manno-heptose-7-phosphate kinase